MLIRYAFLALTSLLLALVLFYSTPAQSRSNNILVLSDYNTVSLNVPITDESAKDVQLKLMALSSKLSANTPIYLTLNSPGGSIDAGFKIIETAKGLPQKVHTVSLFSASMSFIISQYLDKRYVIESATLMSHRAAAGGLEGTVPGSLNTRLTNLTDRINDISAHVAARAHMPILDYKALIADELWMDGPTSVETGFADKVITLACDSSLQGPGEPQDVTVFIFKVRVTWDKCPLIAAPLSVEMPRGANNLDKTTIIKFLSNKSLFLKGQ